MLACERPLCTTKSGRWCARAGNILAINRDIRHRSSPKRRSGRQKSPAIREGRCVLRPGARPSRPVVLAHMLYKIGVRTIAVTARILHLLAYFADRQPLPGHARRGQLTSVRYPGWISCGFRRSDDFRHHGRCCIQDPAGPMSCCWRSSTAHADACLHPASGCGLPDGS